MLAKVEVKKNKLKTNGTNTIGTKNNDTKNNGYFIHSKKAKTDQDIWDEELQSAKSLKLLEMLSENAMKEFDAGKCEPGGFGY
jgi:hypothetical protein